MGLSGLRFHLWQAEIFKVIGGSCGGLLKISEATTNLVDIEKVRIKVSAQSRVDIPRVIYLCEGDIQYHIWVFTLKDAEQNDKFMALYAVVGDNEHFSQITEL